MPKTISATMSRETGPMNGGAIEVSCTLTFDESSPQEPKALQRHLDLAIMACRQALRDEPVTQPQVDGGTPAENIRSLGTP